MAGFRLLCMLLFFPLVLQAQNPAKILQVSPPQNQNAPPNDSLEKENKRIKILNADYLAFKRVEGQEDIQRLIGHVRMKQDSTYFWCDSAYLYEQSNRFEAFRNIRVLMEDSVNLYGDRLTYNGDDKVAKIYDNIRLTDGEVKLRTDRMTYYRESEYGYYENGGILEDEENTLTSQTGHYYPNEDMAYFKRYVRLENPDYVLETDTLGYNTESEIAYFTTYTHIQSEDGDIETTNGYYDTKNHKIYLYDRSIIQDSAYVMIADTIYYDDSTDVGEAWGALVVEQDSSLTILGEEGIFHRRTDEGVITGDAVAIQNMEDDTLYMFADTLYYLKRKRAVPIAGDSEPMGIPVDSISQDSAFIPGQKPADSDIIGSVPMHIQDSIQAQKPLLDSLMIRPMMVEIDSASQRPKVVDSVEYTYFKAFYGVTFFMNELQGKADSLVYFYDDSMIFLYDDPVLWSSENQLTGDSVKIWMANKQVDSLWVGADGFLVSQEDTVGYNQIKGKEMRAKFVDNQLQRLHVIGNSESLYFVRNEDDTTKITYDGMNQASSAEMFMFFEDNEPVKILFKKKPQGTFFPFYMVVGQDNQLEGMKWRPTERPERPDLYDPNIPALPAEGPAPADQTLPDFLKKEK